LAISVIGVPTGAVYQALRPQRLDLTQTPDPDIGHQDRPGYLWNIATIPQLPYECRSNWGSDFKLR
jgi:hypothetical protein